MKKLGLFWRLSRNPPLQSSRVIGYLGFGVGQFPITDYRLPVLMLFFQIVEDFVELFAS